MAGQKIPKNVTYLVKFLNATQVDPSTTFNREVRKRYSTWMSDKKRKHRIIIYEVL